MKNRTLQRINISNSTALEALVKNAWEGTSRAFDRATFVSGLGLLGLGTVLLFDSTLGSKALPIIALGAASIMARVGKYIEARFRLDQMRIAQKERELRASNRESTQDSLPTQEAESPLKALTAGRQQARIRGVTFEELDGS